MKNKSSGFTTLTFVLFISALVTFLMITHTTDETLLHDELQSTETFYTHYFDDESCAALKIIADDVICNS